MSILTPRYLKMQIPYLFLVNRMIKALLLIAYLKNLKKTSKIKIRIGIEQGRLLILKNQLTQLILEYFLLLKIVGILRLRVNCRL